MSDSVVSPRLRRQQKSSRFMFLLKACRDTMPLKAPNGRMTNNFSSIDNGDTHFPLNKVFPLMQDGFLFQRKQGLITAGKEHNAAQQVPPRNILTRLDVCTFFNLLFLNGKRAIMFDMTAAPD